ncbi:hypothetical protein [Alienimonas sp. DA493]|uniref:hypothetical protein n=1 Tax=Alienimonas sp. DA493 TaxID=3373605 RepID=UPI003754AC57
MPRTAPSPRAARRSALIRRGLAAALLALAPAAFVPAFAEGPGDSLGPATSGEAMDDLFAMPIPTAPTPAKTAATSPAEPSGSGVMQAGFETDGVGGGIRQTAGTETPGTVAPPAFPAAGVGRPVDDLDSFFSPAAAAKAAEPKPAAPAKTAAADDAAPASEPSVTQRRPAAPRSAFSAADFGFGPATPAATPAVTPAAATMPADGAAGTIRPVSGTGDPFAAMADPFSPKAEASQAEAPQADGPALAGPEPTAVSAEAAVAADVPPAIAPASAADPFTPAPVPAPARPNPLAEPTDAELRLAEAARTPASRSTDVAPVPAPEMPEGFEEPNAEPTEEPNAEPTGEPVAHGPLVSTIGVGGVGPQHAELSATWRHSGPIRVGRVCTSVLTVSNAGPATAYGVTVTGDVSANMGLAAAEPSPEDGVDTPHPTWTFPTLEAGEQREIRLTYTPTAVGGGDDPAAANRLAAMVTSRLIARGAPVVTEPKLKVELEGPRDVLLGEPATQTILVSNPGTGHVDEVLIEALLPEGLEHRGGPKRLTMNIGALSAGETKPVRLGLLTSVGGVQTISVQVRGEGGLQAETAADIQVKSPQIDLSIDGPGLRYVNRTAAMTLTVSNPGDAATDNVRLGYRVPDGFEFLSADRSGTHDPAGRTVRWFLGRIEAGGSVTATVNLKAVAGGEQLHRAEVSASSRAKAGAEHLTRIEGTASLVLKIQDTDDPVEVGAETEFTVTVSNEGTAAAKTVGLACRVPEGTTVGAVRGPAAYRTEGNLILFDSLPELEPGAKEVYTLRLKGTTPGSKRFQTRLVSESISEPLIHEELTKFYAE